MIAVQGNFKDCSFIVTKNIIVEPLLDNFLLVTDRDQGNILQVDLRSGVVISLTSLIRINSPAVAYNPKTRIIYFINNYAWSSFTKIVEICSMSLISGKLLTEMPYTLPGNLKYERISFRDASFSVK